MVGLTNHIRATVIRNAAGRATHPLNAGCRERALTHPAFSNISYKLPSSCGSNRQFLYDPSLPSKVIHVMNFCGAPSNSFVAFLRPDFDNAIDPQCELEPGDDVVFVWLPLLGERFNGLKGITTLVLPDKRGT
jgi:hypothetical protein